MNVKIILASASPRRRELLSQIGLKFEVKVSKVEERITATEPAEVVEELALQKAEAVFGETEAALSCRGSVPKDGEAVLVIGADTIVAVDGEILGKPGDVLTAVDMLRRLQARSHQVFTGVALLYRDGTGIVKKKVFHERTEVSFYPMTEEEIREYVATGDCMDKAGAYGIQGFCARYIKGVDGDYNNVVGLPIGRLYQEAKEFLL